MEIVAIVLFLAASLINLLPISGVLSADRLQTLYGVAFEDPNSVILMRHRALLLGLVGALLVAAAFHPPLRPAAVALGLASMLSFVVIARLAGGYNPQLRRVGLADLVGSALLVGAWATS